MLLRAKDPGARADETIRFLASLTCTTNQITRSIARVSGPAAVFETRFAANAHPFRFAGSTLSRIAHFSGQHQRAVNRRIVRRVLADVHVH